MTDHTKDSDAVRVIDPLRPSHNIIEGFLVGLVVYTGIRLFLDPEPPTPDTEDVDQWARHLWRMMLLGGGSVVVAGLIWRGRSMSALYLQQIGYLGLGFGGISFGLATWPQVGGVVMAFGVCCLFRVWQIDRLICTVDRSASLWRRCR